MNIPAFAQTDLVDIDELINASYLLVTNEENLSNSIYKQWNETPNRQQVLGPLGTATTSPVHLYATLTYKGQGVAKCTFLKINKYVACFFYAEGRYVHHDQMEDAVKTACNLDYIVRYSNIHILSEKIDSRAIVRKKLQVPEPQSNFEIADFAVSVEGEKTQKVLIKKWSDEYTIKVMETVSLNYQIDVSGRECYALRRLIQANGELITLIHNNGVCSDREALAAKAREWHPKATVLSLEHLPELFHLKALSILSRR